MKYEISKDPNTQFPKNENNTVDTHGTATVIASDEKGYETTTKYGIVKNEDVYKKMNAEEPINIDGCFVENFSLRELRKSQLEINNFLAFGSFFTGGADFSAATFSENAYFEFATFNGNAYFSGATFSGNTDFRKATFNGDAYFRKATFSGYAYFESTTFNGDACFRKATFNGNTDFRSATFSEKTDFQSVRFQNKVDWIETKFIKHVYFSDAHFEHPVIFSNITFGYLDLTGATFDKYALFKDAKIKEGNRETFRIIKNEFMKVNNRIDALLFHTREMEAFERELKDKRIKKDKKYWGKDEIILKLNKFTNHYGTSWPRALVITLLFAFVFSLLLALFGLDKSYYIYGWNDGDTLFDIVLNCMNVFLATLYKTCDLLTQTLKFDYNETKLNLFGKVLSLIARLGIGYGYFQIIQAFRKFKIW